MKVCVLCLFILAFSLGERSWGFSIPSLGSFNIIPHVDVLFLTNQILEHLGLNFFDGNKDTTFAPMGIIHLQKPPMKKARRYIVFAAAAYCDAQLENLSCDACKKFGPSVQYLFSVVNGNVKAYFALDHSSKEIILAFRGSQDLKSIVDDMIMAPTNVAGDEQLAIELHSGLYKMTLNIFDKVEVNLANLIQNFPGYKVIITGHGIGAAEAVISLYLFQRRNLFPNIQFELYTYGGPRVGNKAFADMFNSFRIPVMRVVELADIVPHAVPAYLGFIHHANELFIYDIDGSARYCSDVSYEDPTCSDSLGPVYSIVDHSRYFNADLSVCWVKLEPAERLMQIVHPLKNYLTGSVVDSFKKLSLRNMSVIPTISSWLG